MPFCAQCGTQFQGNFCPACGSPTQTPHAASPLDTPAGGPAIEENPPLDEHVASALCYALWPLTGVLFLVLEPYSSNRTIRFHAYQSVFSFAVFFIGFAALQLLSAIPFLGLIFLAITPIYMFISFGIVLFMAFKAYNKDRFVLPIIGPIAATNAEKRI